MVAMDTLEKRRIVEPLILFIFILFFGSLDCTAQIKFFYQFFYTG